MFVKQFINDFQDMLITEKLGIAKYPDNFVKAELSLLQAELDKLELLIKEQNQLTFSASEEFLLNYQALIQSLKDKISYINSTAEVYNKLNVTYDKNTLVDFKNFPLTLSANALHDGGSFFYEQNLSYSSKDLGLELAQESSTFSLYHGGVELSTDEKTCTITGTNSNASFHNSVSLRRGAGLSLESTSVELIILKVDGTTFTKSYTITWDTEVVTLYHEVLQSVLVTVKIRTDYIQAHSTNYDISLNLTRYKRYGSLVLPPQTMTSADYLIFNQVVILQPDTYLNYNLNLTFSDRTLQLSIPINNNLVCKRLDLLNAKEVKTIVGMYIKDTYTEENLSLEYLLSLEDKTEKYVVYKSKLVDNVVLNNVIKVLDDTSFKLLRSRDTEIGINLTVEFYSFNEAVSPVLKYITGLTKNG